MNRVDPSLLKRAPAYVLYAFLIIVFIAITYLLLFLVWTVVLLLLNDVLLLPQVWHFYGFTPQVLCLFCMHMIFLVIVVKTIKSRMLVFICTVFLILSCVILLQFQYKQIAQSLCYAKLTREERKQPLDVAISPIDKSYTIQPLSYRQCRATIGLFEVFKRSYTKNELTEVPW